MEAITGEPTPSSIVCDHCKEEVSMTDRFCLSCGFPANGTEDEQRTYRLKISSSKDLLKEAEKKIREAKIIIYVLTALTFLMGTIAGFGNDDLASLIVNLLLCTLYLIFAAWSNKNPFRAILTCFIVYLTIQVLNAIVEPATIMQGIIVKFIFIAVFLKGIQSANEAKHLLKELKDHKVDITTP